MLARKDMLPEVPSVLISDKGEVEFDIEYTGPLAFTQQTNQLLAYNRFFANLGTFVELKPDAMDNFLIDDIVRTGAEKSGIPLTQIKPKEEVAAQREAQAQAEAQERQQQDIQATADTAATLTKAGIPLTPGG